MGALSLWLSSRVLRLAAMALGCAAAATAGTAIIRLDPAALHGAPTECDPSTHTDVVYLIMIFTGLMPVIALFLDFGLSGLVNPLQTGRGIRLCGSLPLCIAVPGAWILQSFTQYWAHRLLHMRLFWPIHATHHAAEDFNVITAIRHHPVSSLIASIASPLIPALLGVPTIAITIAVVTFGAYNIYVHSELPTNPFLERWVLVGPRGHGIHHGKDPDCFNTNFGDLVIWDRLFGTYKVDVAEPLVYGCGDPDGIYQSGRPLRDMIAAEAVWLRGLWRAARTCFTATQRSAA
jgi:sterol desaturase/sphingolipid hydroxylase (fatty acid hydroxylase superfamily)